MKYLFVLLIAGAVYVGFFRNSPVAPEAKAINAPRAVTPATVVASSPPPPASRSNILKRPLDRTHQVLDQVRKQRNEDAF